MLVSAHSIADSLLSPFVLFCSFVSSSPSIANIAD
jgi:hypothetical protein